MSLQTLKNEIKLVRHIPVGLKILKLNRQILGGKVSCYRGLDVSLYTIHVAVYKVFVVFHGEDIVMRSRTKSYVCLSVIECMLVIPCQINQSHLQLWNLL